MNMPKNRFKEGLKAGKLQLGFRSQLCSPLVAEVIGSAGYDFVFIDMEGSPNDPMLMLHQFQALAGTPAQPMAKLPDDGPLLMHLLADMGLLNFVVPMVQNPEQAERVVKAMRYPPNGTRSAGARMRANRFGDYEDYFVRADREICMIMQIETREALEQIEQIALVDGVDAILFGPADIANDLGHLGEESTHPEVRAALESSIRKVVATGKAVGMGSSEQDVEHWYALGCRFISVANDLVLLARHARKLISKYRHLK